MNGNLGKFCIECRWIDYKGNWRRHCVSKHNGFVPAHFVMKQIKQSDYLRAESHQRYPAKLQSCEPAPEKKTRIEASAIQTEEKSASNASDYFRGDSEAFVRATNSKRQHSQEPTPQKKAQIEAEPAQTIRDIVYGIREDAGKSHGTSEEQAGQVIYEPATIQDT